MRLAPLAPPSPCLLPVGEIEEGYDGGRSGGSNQMGRRGHHGRRRPVNLRGRRRAVTTSGATMVIRLGIDAREGGGAAGAQI